MKFLSFSKCLKTAVGAFVASSALAFGQYDDGCYNNDCCQDQGLLDGIVVGAEFLYWEPFFDGLDFAFHSGDGSFDSGSGSGSSSGSGSGGGSCGRFHNLNHDWVPAFRVFAGLKNKDCCGIDVFVSYTRVEHSRNRHSRHDSTGTLFSTVFSPSDSDDIITLESISGGHRFTYDAYDLLFSHDFCLSECHQFTPFFGVAGMDINQRRHSRLLGFDDDGDSFEGHVHSKNDFWGVGLKLGTEYRYQLFDCLSLYGRAAGSILAGTASTRNHQNGGGSEASCWRNNNDWHLVPGYCVGVGFRYDTTICDWGVVGTIGYEFVEWFNLPRERRFVSSSTHAFAAPNAERQNFGFQGLNVGLALKF